MTQPSPHDKLTDALIKLVWAGSGSYALYSLYTDDLPKAAISGLVSTGAALMTSFGQGLMGQLTDSMKTRGDRTGKAIDKTLDSTVEIAWAKLSRFHKQYLEALKAHCYAIEIEGVQNLPPLALEEIFVPLRIESNQDPLSLNSGPQQIWDFLPQRYQTPSQYPYRRLVVLAAPGYGKSTLLRHLTLIFVSRPPAEKPEFIPVLLRLRDVYSLISAAVEPDAPITLDLPELIIEHLGNQAEFRSLQPSSSWFGEQLRQGRCLVMLDGLDEVPKRDRQSVRQWVDQQMKIYDKTQFILTSRPHGFELQPDEPSHPIQVDLKLRVLDFNIEQKQDFVEKWYRTLLWRLKWEPLLRGSQQSAAGATLDAEQARFQSDQEADEAARDLIRQIVNSPPLNDLARNPLLVTMIASTHRAQAVLPKRRVELYDKIFDLLLGTRPYVKQIALTLTATSTKVVLQELAWRLMEAEKTQFTLRESNLWIVDVLNRCLRERAYLPEQFIHEMVEIAGLILETERDRFEFSHQTFQEYLAARHLRELGDAGEALLLEQLTSDRWQEVVRFYAALGNATPIINALLEQPNDYTLPLAKTCLDEGREVEPETLNRLQAMLIGTSLPIADHPGEDTWQTNRNKIVKIKAEILLVQRFANLLQLSEGVVATIGLITWAEYQLFLQAQQDGAFHSTAAIIESQFKEGAVVTNISWEDARWFCAWLSTQVGVLLQNQADNEKKVFDYRLPTPEELAKLPAEVTGGQQPWSMNPEKSGSTLLIVREELPKRYEKLSNYLASGLWREADEQTARTMLNIIGGIFTNQKLSEFPCQDLKIIDQLWVKFSGGKFGFSVQKNIYVGEFGLELDGKFPGETLWHDFCNHLGWRKNGKLVDYDKLSADLNISPKGELPRRIIKLSGIDEYWLPQVLMERVDNCGL